MPPYAVPPGPGFDRQRLVRPVNGRYIAGVCAAISRATNTDPILWRVLFAVLTLAGGVGLLGYLVGWLLIPGEGDTASPLESLLGRGQSKTSGPLVIGVGVIAVVTFAVIVSNNVTPAVVGIAVVLGTIALLIRGGQHQQQNRQPANPYAYPGMPPGPPPPGAPMPNAPFPPMGPTSPASATATMMPPAPPAPPFPPYPPEPPVPPRPEPTGLGQPPLPPEPTLTYPTSGAPATVPPFGPLPPAPGGYRPPFAPHGPYASSSPYAASLG